MEEELGWWLGHRKEKPNTKKSGPNSLSAGTAIPPDVPVLIQPLVPPQGPDLGARDALVVAIVPLADVLGDLDARAAGLGAVAVRGGAVSLPGKVSEAQVQQLEGALRTGAGGDESVMYVCC